MNTASQTSTDLAELRIHICAGNCVNFVGAAEQLREEGLIPPGFEWPHADHLKSWEAGGLEYVLRRQRPEGHKGHRWSWHKLDSWRLLVRVGRRDSGWEFQRRLDLAAAELLRHLTPQSERAWALEVHRYWTAQQDAAFQAFKAKVPGLVPPKRGRKPKGSGSNGAPGGEVQP